MVWGTKPVGSVGNPAGLPIHMGWGVDYKRAVGDGVQTDLEVVSGDSRIADHETALFVDPRALATDEELIENRHFLFGRHPRVHDEVGQRLVTRLGIHG